MPLPIGTRLGPYEVLAAIGAGGMGEVYKARDTRLDRAVAIKLLRPDGSADPDHRARFEREARAIAGLNHPNICALHDVGDHEGSVFLVMEHLEGETLASRLERGPLPLGDALQIGQQIADALAAAHRGGIVHRDLKPGNVMLTRSGARLLDFGLAKLASEGEPALPHAVSAATRSAPLTKEGTIVGTLQYMAPEQVEARPTDARTDVWALGAILYEMIVGKRAFEGASGAGVIAAILDRDPAPLAAVQPQTPPAVDRLVRTCLAKDPDRRFQSARDVELEIDWLRHAPASSPTGSSRQRRSGVALGALGGALVALAAAWMWNAPPPPPAPPVIRFTIEVPAQRRLAGLALAREGRDLVYVGIEGGKSMLFRRSRDQFIEEAIPGTDGALSPFFSPDGQWVAFFRAGRLLKVRLDGRELTTICVVPSDARKPAVRAELAPTEEGILYSGFWGDDGTVVFSGGYSGLWRVSSLGAEPAPVTKLDPDRGELAHAWPELLPGSKTVLHSVLTGMLVDAVPTRAASLADGAARPVLPDARASAFLPSGHLVYIDAGSLAAIRFDPDRMELRGTPIPLVDDVGYGPTSRGGAGWAPLFSVSRQGDLAYAVARPEDPSELLRLWPDGRSERIAQLPRGFRGTMSLAPDGRRVLMYKVERGRMSLWVLDVQRGALSRIEDEGNAHSGIWSADGKRLAFSFSKDGTANVFARSADGTGPHERLATSGQHQDPGSWSRDGRWLTYAEINPRTGFDLWALDLTTRAPVSLRQTPANEQYPALSPDGAWLAYSSDETGRFEVYLQAFPGGASRQQVSIDGGSEPVWALDGRQLYFRDASGLLSVPVRDGVPSPSDRPVKILEFPFRVSGAFGPAAYAVPNGQYFYVTRTIAQPPLPQEIRVVLGWSEEVAKQFRD